MGDNMDFDLKKEAKQIIDEIRKKDQELGQQHSETKRFVENTEKKLEEFDKANEELVSKLAQAEKAEAELKDRIEHLERLGSNVSETEKITSKDIDDVMNAMLRKEWPSFIADEKNFKKAMIAFAPLDGALIEGAEEAKQMIDSIQRKATPDLLRSDLGELGAYLCPPEYSMELNKNMIEYSPIRQYCRVKTVTTNVYKEPIRVGIPRATRPGEAGTGGTSTSTYAQEDYTPHIMTNTTPITRQAMMYNKYNLSREIMLDNSEAFAVKEGQEFVSGTGVEEGLGFEVDPNVPQFESTTSGGFGFNDMIELTGELKAGYNPMYFFNRKTLAYLRRLTDDQSRYLWSGPFGDAGAPPVATINGYRYSSAFIDMDDPDVDDGFPVLFADMMRFFQIVDSSTMEIIRDEYTRKKEGIVEFTMHRFCFGKPKIKEAGIRMRNNIT